MIYRLQETNQPVSVQETTFSVDGMGRFICNTWDEAVNNGGVAFDAVAHWPNRKFFKQAA